MLSSRPECRASCGTERRDRGTITAIHLAIRSREVIHRTKTVRWKTVPPLRSPTRRNSARKKKSGHSGPFDFAQGRRNDSFGVVDEADAVEVGEVDWLATISRNKSRCAPQKKWRSQRRPPQKAAATKSRLRHQAAVESASLVPSNCAKISRSVRINSSRDTWLFLNCRRKRNASFSGSY